MNLVLGALQGPVIGDSVKRRNDDLIFHCPKNDNLFLFYMSYDINVMRSHNALLGEHWMDLFLHLIIYEPFNRIQYSPFAPLFLYLRERRPVFSVEVCFINSIPIVSCHTKNEKKNKVFERIANESEGTMNWFYELKLHLIINKQNLFINYLFSADNIGGCDQDMLTVTTRTVSGKFFDDWGYMSQKLVEYLLNGGVELIYKRRKNIEEKDFSYSAKTIQRNRTFIHCIIDQLKNIRFDQHICHRPIQGFPNNLFSTLIIYQIFEKKHLLQSFRIGKNMLTMISA